MESEKGYKNYYFASILLRSDAYEAELNGQILAALRDSPSVSGFATPRVLPGSPNRAYFIDCILYELEHLPFAIEWLATQQEIGQQSDAYEHGRPDPACIGGIWRVMSLDMRVELGRKMDAKMFIRELPSEQHVLISFAFDAGTMSGGEKREQPSTQQMDDLRWYREFLLALTAAYPVLVATIGLDVVALNAVLPDDALDMADSVSLDQLTRVVRRQGDGGNFDFVVITPMLAGGDRPFVYNRIEPIYGSQEIEEGGKYHDLSLVEELRQHAEQAEQAYDRMYESSCPKDDRDDALGYLAQAIRLAGALGLADIGVVMKTRYEHIDEVFNAQFRR